MAITADDLIAGVNRRVLMPANGLSNEDILKFGDQVISNDITFMLKTINQNFFIRSLEIPLVAGQSSYDIPYRSIGRALREIKLKYNTSGAPNSGNMKNLPQINLDDAFTWRTMSTVGGFYFDGDQIHTVPDVPSGADPGASLIVWYYVSPSSLIPSLDANGDKPFATVVAIAGDTVTVDVTPAPFVSGYLLDFVQARSGCDIYSLDVPLVSAVANVLTFGAGLVPSRLQVGDYICSAGTSFVCNFIPDQCYALLETQTARLCVQSIADYESMAALDADAEKTKKMLAEILDPRIEGEPQIILNPRSLSKGRTTAQKSWLYGPN